MGKQISIEEIRDRVKKVDELMASGMTTAKAAKDLDVSIETVRNWRKRLQAGSKSSKSRVVATGKKSAVRVTQLEVAPAPVQSSLSSGRVMLLVASPQEIAQIMRGLQ